MGIGMERQLAIYMAGVVAQKPLQPTRVEDLRRAARETLSAEAWGYLEGSAGTEDTAAANLEAFRRWRIVPRMLCGVARPDPSVELFGRRLGAPLLLAPIGVQSILHAEAEVAVARAASSVELPLVLSTVSSRSLEEIAEVMGDAPRWFQLYWSASQDLTASLIGRAEAAGYEALVVTLDTFQLGWRPRDIDNAYLPFLHGEGLANYLSDPVFLSGLDKSPRDDPQAAARRFADLFSDPSLTWEDLGRIRSCTKLPILLKGILHPDDARRALDRGADGVIVSNHGGRQVDGAIGALAALPGIVDAVGDRTTVLFDSGVRQAADVFKAIALGARATLVGRPYAYALASRGEDGVRDLLRNLVAELDLTMALSGCGEHADLTRERLELGADPGR
jgi:isopentenyl diphosphate isomerase/L-lactate dehydrogenase-like FMN-dependent dehydrogenase